MIALMPLANADERLLDDLHLELASATGWRVKRLDAKLDVERARDETRNQYDSTKLLLHMNERSAIGGADKRLAICPHDLFIPVLTFVFGEAALGGSDAIVSYFRLANERYGLRADYDLLLDRLVKESVHELGHLIGLRHCRMDACVMRSSTSVEEIDLKGRRFCSDCQRHLGSLEWRLEPHRRGDFKLKRG
jgi:archaemetzincin